MVLKVVPHLPARRVLDAVGLLEEIRDGLGSTPTAPLYLSPQRLRQLADHARSRQGRTARRDECLQGPGHLVDRLADDGGAVGLVVDAAERFPGVPPGLAHVLVGTIGL